MDGKPLSFLINGEMPQAEAPRKPLSRAEILERAKATSPGNPIGQGDTRKLNAFRYLYREIPPGTVSSEAEIVGIAREISGALERDGTLHGKPFVLMPTSESGWLFNEPFRVCIPVIDSVKTPPNMKEARFDGAMVAFRRGGQLGESGKIEEMERWAEEAQVAATGSVPESSGPFLMRLDESDSETSGQVVWDWMVPVGPISAAAQLHDAATAPAYLGSPVGRGDRWKLNPFRYIYREVPPKTVSSEAEIIAIAREISVALQRDGVLHGRPFVFMPTSETGWLFNEPFRVCLPVGDSVKIPRNLKEARFDGAMVAFRRGGQLGESGKIEEMERWAEEAQVAATGSVPESSGPFLMRLDESDSETSGQVVWDWIVPVGPIPAAPGGTD